jgi:hypothetical protein
MTVEAYSSYVQHIKCKGNKRRGRAIEETPLHQWEIIQIKNNGGNCGSSTAQVKLSTPFGDLLTTRWQCEWGWKEGGWS